MKSKWIDRVTPGYRPGPDLTCKLVAHGNQVLAVFDDELMTKNMAASVVAYVNFVSAPYLDRNFSQVKEIVLEKIVATFREARFQKRWVYDEKLGLYDVVLN